MWKRGLEPGDRLMLAACPAPRVYLKRAPRPPEGSAALVPGCGRAYGAGPGAAQLRPRRGGDIATTAGRAARCFLEDEADGYEEELGIYYIQIKGTRFT